MLVMSAKKVGVFCFPKSLLNHVTIARKYAKINAQVQFRAAAQLLRFPRQTLVKTLQIVLLTDVIQVRHILLVNYANYSGGIETFPSRLHTEQKGHRTYLN